eukprot:gene2327-3028_t
MAVLFQCMPVSLSVSHCDRRRHLGAGTLTRHSHEFAHDAAPESQHAGAPAATSHPLDGRSLMPLLRNAAWHDDQPLFWRMNHRGQRAMRHGPWKYLRVDGHDYLFNLEGDERERANLAPIAPERLAAMVQAWEAWEATMPQR